VAYMLATAVTTARPPLRTMAIIGAIMAPSARPTVRMTRSALRPQVISLTRPTASPMLAAVCEELEKSGVAVLSEGALCAFPPGFAGRDGTPAPMILRKSDGGYNYSTTDLATIRYRVDELHVDRAIYVVGSDQTLHFQMVFAPAPEGGSGSSLTTALNR